MRTSDGSRKLRVDADTHKAAQELFNRLTREQQERILYDYYCKQNRGGVAEVCDGQGIVVATLVDKTRQHAPESGASSGILPAIPG